MKLNIACDMRQAKQGGYLKGSKRMYVVLGDDAHSKNMVEEENAATLKNGVM